jgi:hypothetical protein
MTILSHAYALSGSTLVSFDPETPSVGTSIPVTGLTAGQTLVGIDVRPANGLLYGLGVNATTDTATLYNISVLTGVATIVGTIGGVGDLPGSGYGFDFNPVVDRIRVTTDTGLNFRINPNNGSLSGLDVMITPAGSQISGVAYTNDETGLAFNGGVTTLYTLDSFSDQLMIQTGPNGNPNAGVQSPVGPVGVGDFSTANGFDIPPGVDTLVASSRVPSGSGLALLTVGGAVQLYSIDLVTGHGTLIGNFLDGITPASGLAILNPPSGADFNVDGCGDLLWRQDSGQVYFWEMNGLPDQRRGQSAARPSHHRLARPGRRRLQRRLQQRLSLAARRQRPGLSLGDEWPTGSSGGRYHARPSHQRLARPGRRRLQW